MWISGDICIYSRIFYTSYIDIRQLIEQPGRCISFFVSMQDVLQNC